MVRSSWAAPVVRDCLVLLTLASGQAFAAPDPQERAKEPATVYTQSDEIKAFRKTAISVSFPSEGLMLRGWMYRPEGDGPFPAVIWNHGSEKRPTAHPELGRFYTSHGYILFLPIRSGHDPSPGRYIGDAIDEYAAGGASPEFVREKAVELHDVYNRDVVAALAWLRDQPGVDGGRLVVTGCSYGGIQTLIAAEKGLGVRAFVSFAP